MSREKDLISSEREILLKKLRPEGTKILISAEKAPDKKGSLYIPRSAQESQQIKITVGHVIAIGPTAVCNFSDELDGSGMRKLVPGDRIIFTRYGASMAEVSDEGDYRFIQDQDIISIC